MAERKQDHVFREELYLCGINTPECVLLLIDREHFSIGKNPDNDGVLLFNDEISRNHCVIDYEHGIYRLKDCGSSNGTAINGKMADRETGIAIDAGDIIQLAGSTFEVCRIKTDE